MFTGVGSDPYRIALTEASRCKITYAVSMAICEKSNRTMLFCMKSMIGLMVGLGWAAQYVVLSFDTR